MLDYWAPYVYCFSDTILGSLLVLFIFLFYEKIWWVASGVIWANPQLYLFFLVIYGFNEELFLHFTFSQVVPQDRPLCTFTTGPLVERSKAMPSLEAELAFSLASFLIVHMFLMETLADAKTNFTLFVLPLAMLAALFVTRNATLLQLFVGAVFGTVNGVRRVLIFHFFLKRPITLLGQYPVFNWIIPKSPLVITRYEDESDQVGKMIGDKIQTVTIEKFKVSTLADVLRSKQLG